ncbi:choline BCCT transporter BetT [Actinomyces israelii]|uniref:Choline BCCT transporter BetT n=1 Tax=Actinomyces israelii TaxID=1659 RepID=A0ABT4IDH2_9ACTO|nr:choline BCCT transporter BetT [Actinomyces israelii]MCZ0859384.1 choline BCCT transporter BetT [Actinomyces israelii]
MPDPADRSETADPRASTPMVKAPGDAPSAPHPTTPDPPDRPDPHEPHPINWGVFLSSAVIIAVVAAAAIISPTTVQDAFNAAVAWAGKWFGSFYIFLITATIVFVVLLALSRYGQVRLGPDNSTPDFSTFSWAAMLFAAGIGTGIMFFSIAEPVAQYVHPPTGEGETIEAARHAVVLAIFHYGISGWGVYAIMGMAMAYFAYRRRDALAVRSTLRPLLGARVDGWIGDVVDTAALVGGVFGIAASLGVGVVQLNVALDILFGIPQGTGGQVGLITLSVIMATISATTGVDRGVRVLSNINVVLAIGLALWVLVSGDTAFLMDALVGTVGDFMVQFPQLTLETYAYNRPEEWLNNWTLFFWAWWITWGAFVGMFLARVSRGRTLREFILGALILPFSYVVMWVAIFGNSALELIRSGDTSFAETTISAPEQGLYLLLGAVGGKPIIAIALFIGVLFYVTSADSGALVMSSLSSRIKGEREDAAPWLRIFWATLTGILTVAMLVAGGVPILQQATLVMALPFSFILVVIMACLLKALHREASLNQARSRAYRNRQVGFTGTAAGLRRISWRDRLSHTFARVRAEQAQRALDERIVPALEAVAAELAKERLEAEVQVEGREADDPDDERTYLGRVTLLVTDPNNEAREGEIEPEVLERAAGRRIFRYVVRMVEAPAPSYGGGMNEADDVTVRLEVRLRGGGVGYDIMDWSADQVAHDVLDHYERWLEYLGTSSTARV